MEKKQHQPLRTPNGWSQQEKSLVNQIDLLFDDIYRMIGKLEERLKALENEGE